MEWCPSQPRFHPTDWAVLPTRSTALHLSDLFGQQQSRYLPSAASAVSRDLVHMGSGVCATLHLFIYLSQAFGVSSPPCTSRISRFLIYVANDFPPLLRISISNSAVPLSDKRWPDRGQGCRNWLASFASLLVPDLCFHLTWEESMTLWTLCQSAAKVCLSQSLYCPQKGMTRANLSYLR